MQNSVINFGGSSVRINNNDGEVWFCASDIANILEYKDATHMIRGLDGEDISLHKVEGNVKGNPNMSFISESGLYQVMLNAKTERVKPFKKWVTREVLPSLRKNGTYTCKDHPVTVYGQICEVPESVNKSINILKAVGFSEGILQADVLERDLAHYNSTGSHFLCKKALDAARDADAKLSFNRSLTDNTKEAAIYCVANFPYMTVTELAKRYGDKRVTTTVINKILEDGGYQRKVGKGKYVKTELSRDLAVARQTATGQTRGKDIINGWRLDNHLEHFLNDKLVENGLKV